MFRTRYGTEWIGVFVLVILLLHVGCHTYSYNPEAVRQNNKERFWPRAEQRVQEFAGSGAHNCGRVDADFQKPGQPDLIKSASECVLQTDAAKQSFLVLYDRRLSGDGIVGTVEGKFYRVSIVLKRGLRDEEFGPDVTFEECSSPLLLAAEGGYLKCVGAARNPLREIGGRWCVISKAMLPLTPGDENRVRKTLKKSDCYASLELARQEEQRQEAELLAKSRAQRGRGSGSLNCATLANLAAMGGGSAVDMYRDCQEGRVPIMNLGNQQ